MTLTAPRPTETRRPAQSVLARAFGITALLSAGGSLLGLLRDLLLARDFGADQGTDAFLVSWTVPETAAPLLIEDAMAFLMVPAFSLAIAADTETPPSRAPEAPTGRATIPAPTTPPLDTPAPPTPATHASAPPVSAPHGPAPQACPAPSVTSPSATTTATTGTLHTATDTPTHPQAGPVEAPVGHATTYPTTRPTILRAPARTAATPPAPARPGADSGPGAAPRPAATGATRRADPVADLVAATLPPLAAMLALVSTATLLGAPLLVHLLAPGLADPGLAVVCTRLTALTILPFGLTGYLSAGLRAHQRFTGPGAVYMAYNTGILAVMVLLHGSLGVRAAAGGVALGSMLMTAVLLPPFSRRCSTLTRRRAKPRGPANLAVSPWALLPIALFTLTRQSQVFVERYLASSLTPGTISHLNYAEKVAQMAMTLGAMVCTVTFPVVARALAEGDHEAARRRVEKDLALVGTLVLTGTAVLLACAPQIVCLLFERGAFTAKDTAVTAAVMRVYSLGLLGQAMVGTLVRPFFSTRPAVVFGGGTARTRDRSDWFPLAAMALGLVVTALLGVTTAPRFGALGLAAANATGITLTAALLLVGIRARGVALRLRSVLLGQLRLLLAAAAATVAAYAAAALAGSEPLPALLLGALAGPAVFVLTAAALREPTVTAPLAVLAARSRDRGRHDEGEGRYGR